MLVRRHYTFIQDSNSGISITTDDVRHYHVVRLGNQKILDCKDKDNNILTQIELDGRVNRGANTNVELDAPVGTRLISVYIMNDEGKTIDSFIHGYDFTTTQVPEQNEGTEESQEVKEPEVIPNDEEPPAEELSEETKEEEETEVL